MDKTIKGNCCNFLRWRQLFQLQQNVIETNQILLLRFVETMLSCRECCRSLWKGISVEPRLWTNPITLETGGLAIHRQGSNSLCLLLCWDNEAGNSLTRQPVSHVMLPQSLLWLCPPSGPHSYSERAEQSVMLYGSEEKSTSLCMFVGGGEVGGVMQV